MELKDSNGKFSLLESEELEFQVLPTTKEWVVYYVGRDRNEKFCVITEKEYKDNLLYNRRKGKTSMIKNKVYGYAESYGQYKKESNKKQCFTDFINGVYREIVKTPLLKKEELFETISLEDGFELKGWQVEIRDDGIYRVKQGEEGLREEQILEDTIELIHKTKYLGRDYFSYKFRDDVYNTQSRTLILMNLRNFVYGGEMGRDVMKKTISYLGDKLDYKSCKTILGFDNGWVLPFLEDKNDYKILVYTDVQKRTFDNCRYLIKDYSAEEKVLIRRKLKTFIDTTQMRRDKLIIIIGWCMTAPFKLALLNYFNFFPGLLLIGDRQSGKTVIGSFYGIHWFGAWKHYLSGGSIKTEARCEDFMATSSFPLHFDELEFVKYSIIEILKSTLTGIHDYIRKISVLEEICKPEIAPFLISTNEAPKPFLDPALNSKMVSLNFGSDEVVKDDQDWITLLNELKKEKLFSFTYNLSKDWKDKDIFKLVEEIEKDVGIKADNSRLKKKVCVVKLGLRLFNMMFDINLENELNIDLLKKSERVIVKPLLDKFLQFCRKAINYEDDYEESKDYDDGRTYIRTIKGKNVKYITCRLEEDSNENYIFKQDNLRDFNECTKESYTMRNLGNLLNDAIKKKDLIRYGRYYMDGVQLRSIRVKKEVFE